MIYNPSNDKTQQHDKKSSLKQRKRDEEKRK